ncbi:hypothetical protein BDQ12DRAFT_75959 [Crucibulum laeve]|uniref:Uncharacterized protein n=1 Tax=Crucibulum laeve TaxID=68775 RepID=A0A5C3M3X0_9AGAR|nr:hypothetical protein BDQ12DRAFT_75959 [Crucibulum laeve]
MLPLPRPRLFHATTVSSPLPVTHGRPPCLNYLPLCRRAVAHLIPLPSRANVRYPPLPRLIALLPTPRHAHHPIHLTYNGLPRRHTSDELPHTLAKFIDFCRPCIPRLSPTHSQSFYVETAFSPLSGIHGQQTQYQSPGPSQPSPSTPRFSRPLHSAPCALGNSALFAQSNRPVYTTPAPRPLAPTSSVIWRTSVWCKNARGIRCRCRCLRWRRVLERGLLVERIMGSMEVGRAGLRESMHSVFAGCANLLYMHEHQRIRQAPRHDVGTPVLHRDRTNAHC